MSLSKPVSPSSGVVSAATKQPAKSIVEVHSRTGYQGTANRGRTVSAISSNSRGARGRGRPRGSGFGRGCGRGHGEEVGGKLSFTSSGPQNVPLSKTRSLANALLEAGASTSNKPMEHFKTASMARKAELAGRHLADRAPDLASVGPLINPSHYAGIRPIPKRSWSGGQRRMSETDSGLERQSTSDGGILVSRTDPQVENEHMDLFDDPEEIMPTTKPIEQAEEKAIPEKEAQPEEERIKRKSSIPAYLKSINGSQPIDFPPKNMANTVNNTLAAAVPTGPRSSILGPHSLPAIKTNLASQPVKPVTRVKFNDYKFRQICDASGEVISVKAQFSDSDSPVVSIAFKDIEKNSQESWVQVLRGLDTIVFDRVCITQDFRSQLAFIQKRVLADGSLVTDSSGITVLDEVAFYLRPVLGLLFNHPDFNILIFPSKCEDWKFIESSAYSDMNAILRYHIFESNHDVSSLSRTFSAEIIKPSLDLKRPYLEHLVEVTLGLQYKKLLPVQKGGHKAHNFYLLFPPKSTSFASFLITWIRSCNPECRVFVSQKEGSWHAFMSAGTGTIIIHETLVPLIFRLPNLGELFNNRGGSIVWCIGNSLSSLHSMAVGDNAIANEPALLRLFPHGGAVFLTPSFLMEEPQKTYELLKWFQSKVSKASHTSWKLVTCYDARQYLLDLAIRKASERESLLSSLSLSVGDKESIAASKGLSHKECEYRFLSYGVVQNLRWYEDVSDENDCPIIYADESVRQDDEENLVTWFAGWTMLKLTLFRRFTVVGTTPRRSNLEQGFNVKPISSEPHQVKADFTRPSLAKPDQTAAVRLLDTPDSRRDISNPTLNTISAKGTIPNASPKIAPGWKRNIFAEVRDTSEDCNASLMSSRRASVSDDASRRASIVSSKRGASDTRALISGDQEGMGMDISDNNPDSAVRTGHGISETADTSILTFIALTGEGRGTAEDYLARNKNDLQQATKHYFSSKSKGIQVDDVLDQDDPVDPAAVLDFSNTAEMPSEETRQYLNPPRVQDDVKRAMELYKSSFDSGKLPSRVDRSGNGSEHQPLTRAGIATDEKGLRFVPRSVRPSVSARPEISIRPRYVPLEDKPVCKCGKRLEGVQANEAGGMSSSSSTSGKISTAQSPVNLGGQLTPGPDSDKPDIGVHESSEDYTSRISNYRESTTEWYSKLQATGQSWEHIYVDGWEGCFKMLGIKGQ
jgi:chromo domain-containing protein 1